MGQIKNNTTIFIQLPWWDTNAPEIKFQWDGRRWQTHIHHCNSRLGPVVPEDHTTTWVSPPGWADQYCHSASVYEDTAQKFDNLNNTNLYARSGVYPTYPVGDFQGCSLFAVVDYSLLVCGCWMLAVGHRCCRHWCGGGGWDTLPRHFFETKRWPEIMHETTDSSILPTRKL